MPWMGPYTITSIGDKGSYQLKNMTGNVLKKRYNGSQLKVFHEQDQDIPIAEEAEEENTKDSESSETEELDLEDIPTNNKTRCSTLTGSDEF